MTVARKEAVKDGENPRSIVARVPCIYYPINFGEKFLLVLLDSDSKVNAVCPTFAKKLDFSIRPTDIEVQKIDGTIPDTSRIVIVAFLVMNKAN